MSSPGVPQEVWIRSSLACCPDCCTNNLEPRELSFIYPRVNKIIITNDNKILIKHIKDIKDCWTIGPEAITKEFI